MPSISRTGPTRSGFGWHPSLELPIEKWKGGLELAKAFFPAGSASSKMTERGFFPGKGHLKPEDEEMRRLKRECERLRRERDILKKAVAIFSTDPHRYSGS